MFSTKLFSCKNGLILRTIINNWAANQHIIMISEESCDSEDWSNDAEKFALQSQE